MNNEEKKEQKKDLGQGAKAVVEMVRTISDNPDEQIVLLDAVVALLLSNGRYSAHVAFTERSDRG